MQTSILTLNLMNSLNLNCEMVYVVVDSDIFWDHGPPVEKHLIGETLHVAKSIMLNKYFSLLIILSIKN